MNDEAAPPELFEATQKAHRVVGAGRALESVENDHERRATLAAGQPVEIDEVAVGGLDPLAANLRAPAAPEQGTPQRLEMAASVPPRRPVGGGGSGLSLAVRPPAVSGEAIPGLGGGA